MPRRNVLRLPRQRARRLRQAVDLREREAQASEELQDLDGNRRGAAHRHLHRVQPEQLEHGMQDLRRLPARTGPRDRRPAPRCAPGPRPRAPRPRAHGRTRPPSPGRPRGASARRRASSRRCAARRRTPAAACPRGTRRGTGCRRTSSARSRRRCRSSATSCARRCGPSGGRTPGGIPRPTSPSRSGCSRSSSRRWRDRASRPSGRRSCPTCR